MGIFSSIGNLLKGGAGVASNFIPGGGLVKGAAGALGGLIGGGGVQVVAPKLKKSRKQAVPSNRRIGIKLRK